MGIYCRIVNILYILYVDFLNNFVNFRAKSKEEQIDTFFRQGDFGYIRERKEELLPLCLSKQEVNYSEFYYFIFILLKLVIIVLTL